VDAPLAGVVVLDLSRLLPGPYATQVLADLGADVIKVEEPGAGDPLRQVPPLVGGHSAAFLALNRGKRSVALDLRQPDGLAAFKALVVHAHVVVEGFRPGAMARLGLSYQDLAALNPRVILCSITGYGQTGPDRERAGHDLNYVARAGVLAYGTPGTQPAVQVADVGGGSLWAVVQVLAALRRAERDGVGAHVDVSMTDGAWSFLSLPLAGALAAGQPIKPGGDNLNGGLPCYRPYPTADGGTVAVAALEPRYWSNLCSALGRPDLLPLAYAQGAEGQQAAAALGAVFTSRHALEWRDFFAGRDCCVEVAGHPGTAHREDPQLAGRGLTTRVDQPGVGPVELPATPLKVSGFQPHFSRPAPALGEHTATVLATWPRPGH
jgi:crotonobetainyl-CoA:carnitine CoA-transferase CaiB-like acyl-CoA transferase